MNIENFNPDITPEINQDFQEWLRDGEDPKFASPYTSRIPLTTRQRAVAAIGAGAVAILSVLSASTPPVEAAAGKPSISQPADPESTPTPEFTPTFEPPITETPTPTVEETPTATYTPEPTPEETQTNTPTPAVTDEPTPPPSPTSVITPTVELTPTPEESPTPTSTNTPQPTPSSTPTLQPTPEPTPTASATAVPTTFTPTPTATKQVEVTPTPTATSTLVATPTPSSTPTLQPTLEPTPNSTPTLQPTPEPTPLPKRYFTNLPIAANGWQPNDERDITPTPTPTPEGHPTELKIPSLPFAAKLILIEPVNEDGEISFRVAWMGPVQIKEAWTNRRAVVCVSPNPDEPNTDAFSVMQMLNVDPSSGAVYVVDEAAKDQEVLQAILADPRKVDNVHPLVFNLFPYEVATTNPRYIQLPGSPNPNCPDTALASGS